MSGKHRFSALAVLISISIAPAVSQRAQTDFSRVRKLIETRMAARSVPSLAVAVAKDGKILWEEGFGWADRENRVAATADTPYSVASITKPITATAVMILKERRKIDLDRPLNDYLEAAKLKGFAANADGASVRRVASHSSGLPLHYQYFFPDEPEKPPAFEETIRRYGIIVFPPGERFNYSNIGYGALGELVARVSGRSYPDFLRDEIFLPLGMHHSSVWVRPDLRSQTAVPYSRISGRNPFYVFDTPGSGAVYSSAHDLALFAMLHLKTLLPNQQVVLSRESIDEMQRPLIDADVVPLKYGIGWFINEDLFGHRCIFHAGGATGAETIIRLIPSERIVAVALSNWNDALPALAVHEMLSVLLPEYGARRRAARESEVSSPRSFQPTPLLLGEWRGKVVTYEREMAITLTFKESGDVHVRLGTQLITLLNDVAFHDNRLTGRMMGDIGTSDANQRGRGRYNLQLDLTLRGDVLNGAVVTEPIQDLRRGASGLSHWAELRRTP